jgi:hypothetical protein
MNFVHLLVFWIFFFFFVVLGLEHRDAKQVLYYWATLPNPKLFIFSGIILEFFVISPSKSLPVRPPLTHIFGVVKNECKVWIKWNNIGKVYSTNVPSFFSIFFSLQGVWRYGIAGPQRDLSNPGYFSWSALAIKVPHLWLLNVSFKCHVCSIVLTTC